MKTLEIVSRINTDFATTKHYYSRVAKFVNSGELWDFCIQTIADPVCMEKIVFANDLGIPPVRSMLLLYERTVNADPNLQFSDEEGKWLGSLMGFVFRFVLGYQDTTRCAVNRHGIRSAALFLDGPQCAFEK